MPSLVSIGECLIEFSTEKDGLFRLGFSGDILNTAVCVKRIYPDAHVSVFTVLGKDHFSSEMIRFMEREGLETEHVSLDPLRPTGLYIVSKAEDGEKLFTYWRDSSAARNLMKTETPTNLAADLLYLTGVTLAILDDEQRDLLLAMVRRHRSKGGKVAFDPNFRERLWESRQRAVFWCDRFYQVSDFALVGVEDHMGMYGVSSTDLIFEHINRCGALESVVKKGPLGVSVFADGSAFELPALLTDAVVDTTGAGDAFNAGYLVNRLVGGLPRQAAEAGLRMSSVIVSFPGGIGERSHFFDRLRASGSPTA